MATPHEKLAESLDILREVQETGATAIKSNQLSRTHKQRLIKNGYIKEVTKGWYITCPSGEQPGDSTSWYASYWQFCADYLVDRYGTDYVLSPEQSLQIHSGNWTVPAQLVIRTSKQANHNTPLPYDTSLWHWQAEIPKTAEIISVERLRIYSLTSSLVYCTPTLFIKNPTTARTVLAMISEASEISAILLEGGHTTIAGRLAGAFRNIGRDKMADDIIKTMRAADYDIRETDPFETASPVIFTLRDRSPYANRIKLIWHEMRDQVIQYFPNAPGIPTDHEAYMKRVEELYTTDAYHSLSIERYRITPELIERVRSGAWDSGINEEDKRQKDAMAARGYWLATQKVRDSIRQILSGKNAGTVADADHGDWYRELFSPSVLAGILKASDLAGYRTHQVYIGASKHVPLNREAVRDAMPTLFELLQNEPEASVRAVLGHFIFVFIHPYMDGNGRMGRLLMNVMLASGGYPWTVIPVEERTTYMNALEDASVKQDIKAFAKFMAYLVDEAMKGRPVAQI